jgi:hypothetical protein
LIQRYHGAKDRAIKKSLEFNITVDYLLEIWNKQKGLCAISGIQMTCLLDEGRIFSNVSIDQINS